MKPNSIFILLFLLLLACQHQSQPVVAPWGDEVVIEGVDVLQSEGDGEDESDFDLDQIQHAGELIALTVSGPETYYDYHGKALGLHAMLCQQLADTLGVRLRIEVCRDTTEMTSRLAQGDADLIAYPMTAPDSLWPGWRVAAEKPLLASVITQWYKGSRLEDAQREEAQLLTTARVKRKVYAPMLSRQGGIISKYDALFQHHSQTIHWDWRLMAAQCYQESTFDPNALSWAGARGLMQIMPTTADHLGLARSQMYDPEHNIAAAARYIKELQNTFSDIKDRHEQQDFILAAYNGGAHHIRDAMALAKREGRNDHSWKEVSVFVLRLSQPQYYRDPLVKNGYMRGSETVDYVRLIRERYQMYRGAARPHNGSSVPQKSQNERHRKKYKI